MFITRAEYDQSMDILWARSERDSLECDTDEGAPKRERHVSRVTPWVRKSQREATGSPGRRRAACPLAHDESRLSAVASSERNGRFQVATPERVSAAVAAAEAAEARAQAKAKAKAEAEAKVAAEAKAAAEAEAKAAAEAEAEAAAEAEAKAKAKAEAAAVAEEAAPAEAAGEDLLTAGGFAMPPHRRSNSSSSSSGIAGIAGAVVSGGAARKAAPVPSAAPVTTLRSLAALPLASKFAPLVGLGGGRDSETSSSSASESGNPTGAKKSRRGRGSLLSKKFKGKKAGKAAAVTAPTAAAPLSAARIL